MKLNLLCPVSMSLLILGIFKFQLNTSQQTNLLLIQIIPPIEQYYI
ncbi:MAG TPA: hypothetical protein [Caudoviricetes sp.]|nr:MAG TPA: hypothetical protein [Caudoviricetes sp.]